MEELKLLPFVDPKLKMPPDIFNFEKENAEEISEQLFIAMRKLGGVGLSANQVGLNKRMFVIGGSSNISEKVIINPDLLSVSDKTTIMKEGCLSYPGLWLLIKRPMGCILKYQN